MIIDTNVTLSRWPFRRLPADEPSVLVAKLRQHGVAEAWAGSFDGLLHRDIGGVNARLADDCRRHGAGILKGFGSVNPRLPDWEEDLRRCAEVYRMPGIRLHPSYHGYTLEDPAFRRLLELATRQRLVVQIAALMEDERTQHPLLRAPRVNLAPLASALPAIPGARVMILNGHYGSLANHRPLTGAGVVFDLANLERIGGVDHFIDSLGARHLLFGSHAPLFVFESALLKLDESALTDDARAAIRGENARRFVAG